MKKLLTALIILALLAAFAGCRKTPEDAAPQTQTPAETAVISGGETADAEQTDAQATAEETGEQTAEDEQTAGGEQADPAEQTASGEQTGTAEAPEVSDAAGTWYLDGELTSDKLTVYKKGKFVLTGRDGAEKEGEVTVAARDGGKSYAFEFTSDGAVLYGLSPNGSGTELCGPGGKPRFVGELALVRDPDALRPYLASLAGVYTGVKEQKGVFAFSDNGSFTYDAQDGGPVITGAAQFTTVLKKDGTYSLHVSLFSDSDDLLLAFPVGSVSDLSSSMSKTGYVK